MPRPQMQLGFAVLLAVFVTSMVVGCPSPADAAQVVGAPMYRSAPQGPCSSPNPANPTFSHTSGNHLDDTVGAAMVPNGITLFGLAARTWQADSKQQPRQIEAAISQWCTNYIRLQISPANLFSASPYDTGYLQAIKSEVGLALHYDNNVILSAQTEKYSDQPSDGPTEETIRFWQLLAPMWDTNPRVWFDVFNEPRILTNPGSAWMAWQDGIKQYVGMQQLVDAVRAAAGTTNLILVEGPAGGKSLNGLPGHLISGSNIAYAVHPYGLVSQYQWDDAIGQAALSVPVVVDEWSEFNGSGHYGSCSANAPTYVPKFLSYLRRRQIGLGVWGFFPGVLVTNTVTFTPTRLPREYSCSTSQRESAVIAANNANNGSTPVPRAQGAGALVRSYFRSYGQK